MTKHQIEALNIKIQQKNFCGPNRLLFSANINQQREIHLELCETNWKIVNFFYAAHKIIAKQPNTFHVLHVYE